MVNYLILLLGVGVSAGQGLVNKEYLAKYSERQSNEAFYNFIQSLARIIIFAIWAMFGMEFNGQTLIYSLLFAVGAILFQLGFLYALKTGPLSITSMLVELSMILPTFYGFIFWNEKITVWAIVGIILVIVSVILMLYQKKEDKDKGKLSLKWLMFVLVAVVGNAFAMIVQKQQQLTFEGKYMKLLLFFAFFILFIFFSIVYFIDKLKNKSKFLPLKSTVYPSLGGIFNGGVNFVTMFLATRLSSQIVYPVLTLLTIIITQLFSVFFYKEKLTKTQIIGLITGSIAIVVLNF